MKGIERFIKKLLEENYDLGFVTAVSKIKTGDTNNSFIAVANHDGILKSWYVRQYNNAVEEQDIRFEHAFEIYLNHRVNGEIQCVLPVRTKQGITWVQKSFGNQMNYYAVFNVIVGNEPYSWEFNALSEKAFESCAEITAKFHAWGYGFEAPEGSGKRESPLEEQFNEWKEAYKRGLAAKKKEPEIYRRYTDYLERELPTLLRSVDHCSSVFQQYRGDLKQCVNHKDLNPGNLMFDDHDEVTAVFDMDWCNFDYRVYDVAWMGYQITASWDTDKWGKVQFQRVDHFIEIYNRVMVERNCPLGPLTERERAFLPVMMMIGALKALADFICYEDHSHDSYRNFVNTWRFIESVKDISDYLKRQLGGKEENGH